MSNIHHHHGLGYQLSATRESSTDEHELQLPDYESTHAHYATNERDNSSDVLPQGASIATSECPWTCQLGQEDEQICPQPQLTNIDDHVRIDDQRHESRERLLKAQETVATRSGPSVADPQTVTNTGPSTNSSSTSACPAVKSRPHDRKLVQRFWLWEISASILSLACMAAVIGVLMYEDGKPLRQWGLGDNYLSPNVVVSFLGTLAKSSCLLAVAEILSQLKWLHFHKNPQNLSDIQLFDDASRGPWGAIKLVLRRSPGTILTICASIITVASLLIDPFIQSAFQFPSILMPIQGTNPAILSTQIYDTSYCELSSGLVNTALKNAVLTPILNATKEPNLPCGFERCEWPTINTLGVCSSCIDLTHTIVSECTGQLLAGSPNMAVVNDDGSETPITETTFDIDCNYTLPKSKNTFNFAYREQKWNTSSAQRTYTVWTSAWETDSLPWLPTAKGLNFRSRQAILSNFTYLQFDKNLNYSQYQDVSGRLISDPPVKKAMQCALQLCAKTFEKPYFGNFTAGALTGPQVGLNMSTNSTILDDNSTIFLGLEPESITPRLTNVTFHINNCDFWNLMVFMRSFFTGAIDTTEFFKGSKDADFGPENGQQWSAATNGTALSSFDDMPALMQKIADSMTEEFRTSSTQSLPIGGVALQSEVIIAINWNWLALPISVTIFTFFLLLAVIRVNNKSGISAWKSSSLALLFHELDGWEDNKNMIFDGPDKVEARAKEMRAQVTYQDDLLRFSKAD